MEPSEVNPTEQVPPRKRRFRLQWSLTTMLLLMVVVAGWVPYFCFRQEISRIEQRIAVMRPMARELIVEDPTQVAVVHLPPLWYDEHRWAIHLPEGEYRMKLATREVDEEGFPAAVKQTPLGGGEYRIELLQSKVEDCRKMTITVDDRRSHRVIEPIEKPGWPPSHGSSSSGLLGNCTQMPSNEPIVLFRRRYMVPTATGGGGRTPQGPSEGLMLWIEPVTEKQVGR